MNQLDQIGRFQSHADVPARRNEMAESLTTLDVEVKALAATIEDLWNRLAPVTRPSPVSNGSASPQAASQVRSEVVGRILGTVESLQMIRASISDRIGLLDL